MSDPEEVPPTLTTSRSRSAPRRRRRGRSRRRDRPIQLSGTGDDVQSSGDDEQSPDDNDDGDEPRRIVDLDSVPTDSTLVFEARDGRRGVNCILHRRATPSPPGATPVPTSPRSRWTRVGARLYGGTSWCVTNTARSSNPTTASARMGPALAMLSTASRSRFGTATCTDRRALRAGRPALTRCRTVFSYLLVSSAVSRRRRPVAGVPGAASRHVLGGSGALQARPRGRHGRRGQPDAMFGQ